MSCSYKKVPDWDKIGEAVQKRLSLHQSLNLHLRLSKKDHPWRSTPNILVKLFKKLGSLVNNLKGTLVSLCDQVMELGHEGNLKINRRAPEVPKQETCV